jgi:hypothetical protein
MFLVISSFSNTFKGSVTRDFQLPVFSQISFPQGPVYPTGAISNFHEKVQILLKVKVNEKNVETESFSIFRCF